VDSQKTTVDSQKTTVDQLSALPQITNIFIIEDVPRKSISLDSSAVVSSGKRLISKGLLSPRNSPSTSTRKKLQEN